MINRTLPMLDATNFLAFLQTEQSITNGEFTLSSLDKLFNTHITDHISTEKKPLLLHHFAATLYLF